MDLRTSGCLKGAVFGTRPELRKGKGEQGWCPGWSGRQMELFQ